MHGTDVMVQKKVKYDVVQWFTLEVLISLVGWSLELYAYILKRYGVGHDD